MYKNLTEKGIKNFAKSLKVGKFNELFKFPFYTFIFYIP